MSRRRRDFPAFFDHLFSSCSGASSRRSFSNSGRSSTIFFHFRFISFRFLTFSFYFIILNLLPFFFVCFYLISFDFYFRWRLPPLLKWRRRRLRCELPFRDSFRDAFGILSGFVVSFSFSFFSFFLFLNFIFWLSWRTGGPVYVSSCSTLCALVLFAVPYLCSTW